MGVVSFGVDGCVNPDFPGVYFRIASQVSLIGSLYMYLKKYLPPLSLLIDCLTVSCPFSL